MTIELALATKEAATWLRDGFSAEVATNKAESHLIAQGFGAEHAKRIAIEAVSLVA